VNKELAGRGVFNKQERGRRNQSLCIKYIRICQNTVSPLTDS